MALGVQDVGEVLEVLEVLGAGQDQQAAEEDLMIVSWLPERKPRWH